MATLHLIIHKHIMEKWLARDFISADWRKQLESTLARIDYVIETEDPRHVKEFERTDLFYRVVELCEGYTHITCYGFKRDLCLKIISEKLYPKGYIVSWDISGTTD